ncbi:MAG: class II D-tagatose-bisphosphate aldolase, non-catalytic subunit, partial [Granulosicoccus sp.]
NDQEQWLQRHFSLSDRIRYYWPSPEASKAVETLLSRLSDREIPPTLLHQYFPELGIQSKPAKAHALLLNAVTRVLHHYHTATTPGTGDLPGAGSSFSAIQESARQ